MGRPPGRRVLALAIPALALGLAVCDSGTPAAVQPVEYTVYRAALDSLLMRADTAPVVIGANTIGGNVPAIEKLRNDRTLSAELRADFVERNAAQVPLENQFGLPGGVTLIAGAELDTLFDEDGGGWKAFFRRFPGSAGVVGLSRVGFTADSSLALVYIERGCGPDCGGGFRVVLERDGERWSPRDITPLWKP
jgi:hypothetical protein